VRGHAAGLCRGDGNRFAGRAGLPRAIGAFRRDALAAVGGLSGDALAEDTDLTGVFAASRPADDMGLRLEV
jgi:hypothetical protein